MSTLTWCQDAVDELLSSDLSVLVLVNASEKVHDARLLVVHPAHVLFPPYVEVKVGEFFELKSEQTRGEYLDVEFQILTDWDLAMSSANYVSLTRNMPPPACPGHRWVYVGGREPAAKPAATWHRAGWVAGFLQGPAWLPVAAAGVCLSKKKEKH